MNSIQAYVFGFAFFFLGLNLHSLQAQEARETKASLMKLGSQDALTITIPGQPKNVETVIKDQIKKYSGGKVRSKRGIIYVEGVSIRPLGSDGQRNYYFQVDETGEFESQVYLWIGESDEVIVSSSESKDEFSKAKEYLEGLPRDVRIYELGLSIAEQNTFLDRAVKDHEKMIADSVKLEQKMADLIQAIDQNKIDRANQVLLIDETTQSLENLKDELQRVESGASPAKMPEPPELENQ